MNPYEPIAALGELQIQPEESDTPGKIDPTRVWLMRQPHVEGDEITLSLDELRWLIHTGGPAALAAIERNRNA